LTQPTCKMCDRPVPDQGYVCEREATRTAEALLRIVDLAPEVESAIAKLVRFGGQVIGGSGESPVPWNDTTVVRAASIGNEVATWARHVSESRGRPVVQERWPGTFGPLCYHSGALPLLDPAVPPCIDWSWDQIRLRRPLKGVALAAHWLAQREQLRWLRHRPEAAEAFGSLQAASSALEGLVGRPPELRYRGPCWADLGEVDEAGEQLRCQEILYARPGSVTMTCRACGEEYDVEYRRDWLLAEARSTLAHAELIARALMALGIEGVTASRIRGYAHRGRLLDYGTDRAGRPQYKVGEVLDLVDEQAKMDAARAAKREQDKARREAKKRETAA